MVHFPNLRLSISLVLPINTAIEIKLSLTSFSSSINVIGSAQETY